MGGKSAPKLPGRWGSGGTYVLLLHLPRKCAVPVGALGAVCFSRGHYAYVGSAQGPGGLRGRLLHHLRPAGAPHWHVDHLRLHAGVRRVWFSVGAGVREHAWAEALVGLPGATLPVRRFGASDCRCPAHLVRFSAKPSLTAFRRAVTADDPGGGTVRSWRPGGVS